jgi:3-methyladenine DNA glycosylase AlkD
MPKTIANIRNDLKQKADKKTQAGFQRFFKEPVKCYGVRSGIVAKIARARFVEVKNLSKAEIFALATELFRSGYSEEAFVAANWVYYIRQQFAPADIKIFARWIDRYIDDWAKCDTFCNHTVGSLVEMYPDLIRELKKWARSKKRWLKRAAAVSLIIPAKRGKFLNDIFMIAEILLIDPDDMVQKGYGWMLKAASRKHRAEVFKFVLKHKAAMPRTALRYAIEKMPVDLRRQAMA